jgi:rhodanese-related sulfurtransferase
MFKRRNLLLLIILTAVTLVLVACSSTAPAETETATEAERVKNADGYVDINVDTLNEMLGSKDFTLVNVHIPYAGDIPDTDLSIAYNDLEPHLGELPEDKDAPLVIYCRSGSMSTQAAEELVSQGYTNVMELDGGMNAWQSAGYDLVLEQ